MKHMNCKEIISKLRANGSRKNVEGMARFGISSKNTLGVGMPYLRDLARTVKKEAKREKDVSGYRHDLALKLWNSKIHEARIVAVLVDDPDLVTEAQMESWVSDLESWDLCDQACGNLFDRTEFAYDKAAEWSERKEEFVKRAGFVLMATLAVHDKSANDGAFIDFFPYIKKECVDERNFVKKAVNWALRQIGKRNRTLNKEALKVAKEIRRSDSRSAKWIAGDAIRELENKRF